MMPTYAQIEVPLLEALIGLGGQANPKNVYPLVTSKFPQLTPDDLALRLKHGEIRRAEKTTSTLRRSNRRNFW